MELVSIDVLTVPFENNFVNPAYKDCVVPLIAVLKLSSYVLFGLGLNVEVIILLSTLTVTVLKIKAPVSNLYYLS